MTPESGPRGTLAELTSAHYRWLKGVLRYTRTMELATLLPDGDINLTTLYGSVIEVPNSIGFRFKSFATTRHSQSILKQVLKTEREGRLNKSNGTLKIVNSASPEINLCMKVRAQQITDPLEIKKGMEEYTFTRVLKNERPKGLGPHPNQPEAEILFGGVILSAATQGPCLSDDGTLLLSEGSPEVDLSRLCGFYEYPPLYPGQAPPRTLLELDRHLALAKVRGLFPLNA